MLSSCGLAATFITVSQVWAVAEELATIRKSRNGAGLTLGQFPRHIDAVVGRRRTRLGGGKMLVIAQVP